MAVVTSPMQPLEVEDIVRDAVLAEATCASCKAPRKSSWRFCMLCGCEEYDITALHATVEMMADIAYACYTGDNTQVSRLLSAVSVHSALRDKLNQPVFLRDRNTSHGAGTSRLGVRKSPSGSPAFELSEEGVPASPLHYAVLASQKEAVISLLVAGCHPLTPAPDGTTPIHIAAAAADAVIYSVLEQAVRLQIAQTHSNKTSSTSWSAGAGGSGAGSSTKGGLWVPLGAGGVRMRPEQFRRELEDASAASLFAASHRPAAAGPIPEAFKGAGGSTGGGVADLDRKAARTGRGVAVDPSSPSSSPNGEGAGSGGSLMSPTEIFGVLAAEFAEILSGPEAVQASSHGRSDSIVISGASLMGRGGPLGKGADACDAAVLQQSVYVGSVDLSTSMMGVAQGQGGGRSLHSRVGDGGAGSRPAYASFLSPEGLNKVVVPRSFLKRSVERSAREGGARRASLAASTHSGLPRVSSSMVGRACTQSQVSLASPTSALRAHDAAVDYAAQSLVLVTSGVAPAVTPAPQVVVGGVPMRASDGVYVDDFNSVRMPDTRFVAPDGNPLAVPSGAPPPLGRVVVAADGYLETSEGRALTTEEVLCVRRAVAAAPLASFAWLQKDAPLLRRRSALPQERHPAALRRENSLSLGEPRLRRIVCGGEISVASPTQRALMGASVDNKVTSRGDTDRSPDAVSVEGPNFQAAAAALVAPLPTRARSVEAGGGRGPVIPRDQDAHQLGAHSAPIQDAAHRSVAAVLGSAYSSFESGVPLQPRSTVSPPAVDAADLTAGGRGTEGSVSAVPPSGPHGSAAHDLGALDAAVAAAVTSMQPVPSRNASGGPHSIGSGAGARGRSVSATSVLTVGLGSDCSEELSSDGGTQPRRRRARPSPLVVSQSARNDAGGVTAAAGLYRGGRGGSPPSATSRIEMHPSAGTPIHTHTYASTLSHSAVLTHTPPSRGAHPLQLSPMRSDSSISSLPPYVGTLHTAHGWDPGRGGGRGGAVGPRYRGLVDSPPAVGAERMEEYTPPKPSAERVERLTSALSAVPHHSAPTAAVPLLQAAVGVRTATGLADGRHCIDVISSLPSLVVDDLFVAAESAFGTRLRGVLGTHAHELVTAALKVGASKAAKVLMGVVTHGRGGATGLTSSEVVSRWICDGAAAIASLRDGAGGLAASEFAGQVLGVVLKDRHLLKKALDEVTPQVVETLSVNEMLAPPGTPAVPRMSYDAAVSSSSVGAALAQSLVGLLAAQLRIRVEEGASPVARREALACMKTVLTSAAVQPVLKGAVAEATLLRACLAGDKEVVDVVIGSGLCGLEALQSTAHPYISALVDACGREAGGTLDGVLVDSGVPLTAAPYVTPALAALLARSEPSVRSLVMAGANPLVGVAAPELLVTTLPPRSEVARLLASGLLTVAVNGTAAATQSAQTTQSGGTSLVSPQGGGSAFRPRPERPPPLHTDPHSSGGVDRAVVLGGRRGSASSPRSAAALAASMLGPGGLPRQGRRRSSDAVSSLPPLSATGSASPTGKPSSQVSPLPAVHGSYSVSGAHTAAAVAASMLAPSPIDSYISGDSNASPSARKPRAAGTPGARPSTSPGSGSAGAAAYRAFAEDADEGGHAGGSASPSRRTSTAHPRAGRRATMSGAADDSQRPAPQPTMSVSTAIAALCAVVRAPAAEDAEASVAASVSRLLDVLPRSKDIPQLTTRGVVSLGEVLPSLLHPCGVLRSLVGPEDFPPLVSLLVGVVLGQKTKKVSLSPGALLPPAVSVGGRVLDAILSLKPESVLTVPEFEASVVAGMVRPQPYSALATMFSLKLSVFADSKAVVSAAPSVYFALRTCLHANKAYVRASMRVLTMALNGPIAFPLSSFSPCVPPDSFPWGDFSDVSTLPPPLLPTAMDASFLSVGWADEPSMGGGVPSDPLNTPNKSGCGGAEDRVAGSGPMAESPCGTRAEVDGTDAPQSEAPRMSAEDALPSRPVTPPASAEGGSRPLERVNSVLVAPSPRAIRGLQGACVSLDGLPISSPLSCGTADDSEGAPPHPLVGQYGAPLVWLLAECDPFTSNHAALLKVLVPPESPDSVSLNRSGPTGETLLTYAVRTKKVGLVKALLEHPEIQPTAVDFFGRTPVGVATETHASEAVMKLLRRAEVLLGRPGGRWAVAGRKVAMETKFETIGDG